MTRVELWMEGDKPHLQVHTQGEDFLATKRDLEAMLKRLAREIEQGPQRCPFRE